MEENLFEDFEVEQTSETDESMTEEIQPETETQPEEKAETPFGLKVKYNGEEKVLNEDDARTFAQKGMNYDRIYDPLQKLARMNGVEVGEYLNRLNDAQINLEVSKEIESLKSNAKYEGVSDEVLEEIARNHVEANFGKLEREYEEQVRGQADAQKAQVQKDIDRFMNEYPEFKDKGPEALDPKVFDYVKQGYSLLEAYNKFLRENPDNLAKEKTSKLNEENKRKSLGNTTNAGNVDSDDFLSGFLNG